MDFETFQRRLRDFQGRGNVAARAFQAMRSELLERMTQRQMNRRPENMIDRANSPRRNSTSQSLIWPLHGVHPYFNPYLPFDYFKRDDASRQLPHQGPIFVGSVTATVSAEICVTSIHSKNSQSVVKASGGLKIYDRSHFSDVDLFYWSGMKRKRLLIEMPRMFTALYKQVSLTNKYIRTSNCDVTSSSPDKVPTLQQPSGSG